MAFFQKRSGKDDAAVPNPSDGERSVESEVDWEFGSDDFGMEFGPSAIPYAGNISADQVRHRQESPVSQYRSADSNLVEPFRGEQGAARVESVKRSLDLALERWWQSGEMASGPVLRDGLLVLEAGNDLPESQRSLLLRTAIQRRTGMLTALAHQTDPERTALILQEAMFGGETGLGAETVAYLRLHDAAADDWAPLLADGLSELRDGSNEERRRRIDEALVYLNGEIPLDAGTPLIVEGEAMSEPTRWTAMRTLILVVALAFLVAAAFWQVSRFNAQDMILIPAGDYRIINETGSAQTVRINNVLIDRTEITNRHYRRCHDQGVCPWPTSNDSITRSDYFLDKAFDVYPIVNIDRADASTFCRWLGKRLPSEAEWHVAAAIAPATGLYYAYPWGNQFQERAANGARSGPGDTMAVGQFRPVGDSPFGLTDMAGNVAEWTSSNSDSGSRSTGIVKGGSFQDAPEGLLAASRQEVAEDFSAPWLGFRCAQPRGTVTVQ